jgi:hypothetical protein
MDPNGVGVQSSTPYDKRTTLKKNLEAWRQAHDEILTMPARDNICLLISFTLIWIMVGSSASTDEMQFDRFQSQFNLVVELAEKLPTLMQRGSDDDIDAVVDIELVPVLYYVAVKCRHPSIRRRAIALLKACPRRESLWDGACTARVTEEIVEIEEGGREVVVDQATSSVDVHARVCRLYVWTDWELRRSEIRFRIQGMPDWSPERNVQW